MRELISRESGVSEIIGVLLLIAIISLAVGITGVTILSSVNISRVPAITFSITHEGRDVFVVHNGGDTLPAGSYRIYVDGEDQTSSFSPMPSTTLFRTGTILHYSCDSPPRDVMIVSRGMDGKETTLVKRFFT